MFLAQTTLNADGIETFRYINTGGPSIFALPEKLIEMIAIFADHLTVKFKSGATIDIEAQDKAPCR